MLFNKHSLFLFVIFTFLLSGCAAPSQSSSFGDTMNMMVSRKDLNDYKEFRTQFINHARSRDTEKLLEMTAPYNYEKSNLISFYENEIFPFFSDFKEVTGNMVNIVEDEYGDPGYTLYEFIITTNGEKRPYAIAIIEKNKMFAVKNIIVDQCFKQFHGDC